MWQTRLKKISCSLNHLSIFLNAESALNQKVVVVVLIDVVVVHVDCCAVRFDSLTIIPDDQEVSGPVL